LLCFIPLPWRGVSHKLTGWSFPCFYARWATTRVAPTESFLLSGVINNAPTNGIRAGIGTCPYIHHIFSCSFVNFVVNIFYLFKIPTILSAVPPSQYFGTVPFFTLPSIISSICPKITPLSNSGINIFVP
jgi:hypothetical protein